MKVEFINREENNTRLILVFAGWSTGVEVARNVKFRGWDVAVVHDYSDLTLDTSFLNSYYTVYLFAWSLGVYCAGPTLPADRITAAFAINGTPTPVSDTHGIPTSIYLGTADQLTERTLEKFRMRMAGSRENFAILKGWKPEFSEDEVENLRQQLYLIHSHSEGTSLYGTNSPDTLPWVRVFISEKDRIFPAENMERAWGESEAEIIKLDAHHFLPLETVIGSVISDTDKVAYNFEKASISYDTHAIAQYKIATELAELLKANISGACDNLLEIGCGTGLFTHEYARFLHPERATFVDIAKAGPFCIAQEEIYFQEDAELWIQRQQDTWDAIVSASAIQWFADIPRFLKECHRCLSKDGVLCISTFRPGNLDELDTLRPTPLLYPDAAKLRNVLEKYFEHVEIHEDDIKVEFRSFRDMLIHLKHTGVAGSASSGNGSIKKFENLRSLTYRPIYILATKKRQI